jgi:hypothetical protein
MEKIDLNRASASDLEKISGITRTLAKRIITARDNRGGFRSIEDLRDIEGVEDDHLDALVKGTRVNTVVTTDERHKTGVLLDPNGKNPGRYDGYKVTASFSVKLRLDDTEESAVTAGTATGYTSNNGVTALTLPPPKQLQGSVTFTARAPSGEIVGTRDIAPSEIKAENALPVTPLTVPTSQPTQAAAFGRPSRLRGRVIDRAGRSQISNKQVIIWASEDEHAEDKDFVALIAVQTDGTGYFSGAYPLGSFASAHATVALDRSEPVPIHLDDSGNFPGEVILVVDAPRSSLDAHDDDGDCGCSGGSSKNSAVLRNPDADDLVNGGGFSSDVGQGRCVDFTRPDRTLQEFSYSYVVRTTEPSIKGMTLQEPTKLPPQLWAEIMALAEIGNSNRTMAMEYKTGDGSTPLNLLRSRKLGSSSGEEGESESLASTMAGVADFSPSADFALKMLNKPEKMQASSLREVAFSSKYADIMHTIGKLGLVAPERSRMDCKHPVDWDFEPTIYQACTIAHGHLLHFKQEWIADGYSMGRLLYSLPLAPGQKKQIAVLDWERRESAVRQESQQEEESLVATVSRDRDIGEMVNSVLTESSRGGSSADTGSFGGGIGIGAILGPVGGLLGIGGGSSSASSSAWQNSSRNVAANSLQTLRDRTSQAAAAMRAQRSTVIQSVSQGERVSVTTETVANYNHCHAMTVEYFEVLRHLIVRQRLVDVQECLFVPLQMSRFDRAKALRWRHTLQPCMPTRDLRLGFDALERIDNNYEGSDLPLGTYADQSLDYVEGDLSIRFQLARPRDKDDDFDPVNWGWFALLIPSLSAQEQYKTFLKDQQFKDRIFLEQFGPRIARAFVDLMTFYWVDVNNVEHPLPIDTTLLSNFVNDSPLSISLRLGDALSGIPRKDIKFIKISELCYINGVYIPFLNVLPAGSRAIVESGRMSYRTKYSSGYLFNNGRILNDITGLDAVRIYTPLNGQELRNPREEDKERARRLLDHLNENIERYHHALWWRMSPDRRYMLLDGFEAPNSGGRSVASVVENRLIGLVGNSMIMPVARGFHLDPTYNQDKENPVDLLEHYQPNTPIDPVRVAIPTRGVYAEAVMGACNSCEVKEEERFWRWEESPIPDNPPAILPVSTDSRRADPPDMTAKDYPAPIIAMQSSPAAPDPTGLGAALNLLGQSNLFKDITGLEGNQRNAIEGLKAALSTAQSFGDKASNLALQAKMSKDIDRTMRAIDTAKQQGLLTEEQARNLTQGAIQSMIGAGPVTDPKPMNTKDIGELTQTAGANAAAVKVSRPGGEQVEVDARQPMQDNPRPVIILGTDTATGNRRAFNPATNDISGAVSLNIIVRNAPTGYNVRWMPADADALDVVSPTAETTVVRGKKPGKTRLDVAVYDGSTQIASTRLNLCVPQFVTVDEDAAAFSAVLTELQINGRKADVLAEAKRVCRQLLSTSNVRTVWRMAGFAETLPAHIPASLVTTATIKGEPPAADPNLFGVTRPSASGVGATVFDETIDLFPGAYDNTVSGGATNMVDVESQAILLQIRSEASPSAALLDFAVKVFGRMIGETLAHEIVHSLLGFDIPTGHNSPAIANDLMNNGFERSFRQRTGIEDLTMTSPVDPAHFSDHGIIAIGGLQATNQGRIDAVFPVPPTFN